MCVRVCACPHAARRSHGWLLPWAAAQPHSPKGCGKGHLWRLFLQTLELNDHLQAGRQAGSVNQHTVNTGSSSALYISCWARQPYPTP